MVRWLPPPPGVVKINTDAALNSLQGRTGLGMVARDCDGKVVASSCRRMSANFHPQVAEALALLAGF